MFSVFELLEQVLTSLAESKSPNGPKPKQGRQSRVADTDRDEIIVFLAKSNGSSRNFSISRFDELSDELRLRSKLSTKYMMLKTRIES